MRARVVVRMAMAGFLSVSLASLAIWGQGAQSAAADDLSSAIAFHDPTAANAVDLVSQGRQIFRFDTFADESFWGDMLRLHQAIEGAALGGVGPGLNPKTVLSLGLKVDIDALPRPLLDRLQRGQVNLNDPAVTLQLLQLNAVVGLTGFFNSSGTLRSVGIQ